MTGFGDQTWQRTSALRQSILELPFILELAEGTLSRDRFRFYMIQDALYLEQFSRALAIASAKAPDAETMEQLARSAVEALVVERALHEGFFERFGVDAEDAAAAEPSPTCLGYTNFLLATAHQASFEELAAAVLPCFWIYWDVGNHIAARAGEDNPYRAWIDTYSDPAFGETVDAIVEICDRAAAAATPVRREAMRAAFRRSTQFEWMFWDSAYRLERWPAGA